MVMTRGIKQRVSISKQRCRFVLEYPLDILFLAQVFAFK